MALREIAKKVEKFTIDNSPTLLTAFGAAGVVTTAFFAGKAAFKSAEIIREASLDAAYELRGETDNPVELTTKAKFLLTWQLYIPACGTGLASIAAIIGANQIGTRRAAAMATAYTLSEKAFTEYKEKIVEKLGEKKERALHDELQQDRVNRNPVGGREVIIMGGGNQLCYDAYSGRYFESDMEALKFAQNALNYQIVNNNYASLSDYYDLIGLPHTSASDEIGWNSDKLLEVQYTTTLAEDGRPAIALGFRVEPIRDYFRLH